MPKYFKSFSEFKKFVVRYALALHSWVDVWPDTADYKVNSIEFMVACNGERYRVNFSYDPDKWDREWGCEHMITLPGHEDDTLWWIFNRICCVGVYAYLMYDREWEQDVTYGLPGEVEKRRYWY